MNALARGILILLVAGSATVRTPRANAAPSTNEPPVLLARGGERKVAVGIVRDADYVAVPIHALPDSKSSLSGGGDEPRQALEHIAQKASAHDRFLVLRGDSLVPGDPSGPQKQVFAGGSPSPTDLRLLVPLGKEDSLSTAAAEVVRFLESSRPPGRVRLETGQAQLAVRNPESHRSEIIRAINRDLNRVRGGLGLGHARIGGLESPVQARQLDSRRVELTISYTMTVTDQQ